LARGDARTPALGVEGSTEIESRKGEEPRMGGDEAVGRFGRAVRGLRESRRLSVNELASRASVAPEVLSGLERGVGEPGLRLIVTLCRALDVTPTTLLGEIVHGPEDALTPRQRQVLLMLSDGRAYSEVAAALHITVETVRTHARRIRGKLGVRTSHELRGVYVRSGDGASSVCSCHHL
jgi:DNA-binding CsgD family transcriptional regulator